MFVGTSPYPGLQIGALSPEQQQTLATLASQGQGLAPLLPVVSCAVRSPRMRTDVPGALKRWRIIAPDRSEICA
jgi:hypothetical protein